MSRPSSAYSLKLIETKFAEINHATIDAGGIARKYHLREP